MNENIELLLNKASELEWNVYDVDEEEEYVKIGKFSPAGLNFSFNINITDNVEDFIQNIYDYYLNFDISDEAPLWVDEFGRCMNGVPYDMNDIYEDMEACESNIKELYDYLVEINKN